MGNENRRKNNKKEIIQWHNGFYNAMQVEFSDEKERLDFLSEYSLNKKPFAADMIIRKKEADYEIKNDIGRFFSKHNLIEYKSPDDSFGFWDFVKVLVYAGLYILNLKLAFKDITITVIRQRMPNKLFKYLKEENSDIIGFKEGIYYVDGFKFKIQFVILSKINSRDHIWLRALCENVTEQEARDIISQAKDYKKNNTVYYEMIDCILQIVMQGNVEIFEKIQGDEDMCQAFFDLFAEEISKRDEDNRREGRKEGRREGRREGRKEGRREGRSLELIELVKEGLIKVKDAARRLDMSEEEFSLLLNK